MKKLLSGITLGIVLCGLYATAQQPHVTQTLPSATVKLNGAAGGGGSGTGFVCDAGACVFQASTGDEIEINSDSTYLNDEAGNSIFGVTPTGALTYVQAQLVGTAKELRDITTRSTTGTFTGTNILCSTGAGAVVGTLDADAATNGRFVYITRSGANTCTIGVESGHTLDGVTDGTTTIANGGSKTFKQSGDTAWITTTEYPVTGTLSGLTATRIPVATSATAVGDSAITHNSTTGVTDFAGTAPYISLKDMAGTSDTFRIYWEAASGQILLRNTGNTGFVALKASRFASDFVSGQVEILPYNNDLRMVVEGYHGAGYGYHMRSTAFLASGAGSAAAAMDTFWGRASAGVWGAYTDSSGTLGSTIASNVTGSHFLGGGSAPTVGGSCGTSPTIAGKDAFIKVTTGSGSPTSCEVTFAVAYSTAPVCNANASTTTTALNVATTTTTVTVSAAALTAAEVLHISCGSF